MDVQSKVRNMVANIAGVSANSISDSTSFRNDLGLSESQVLKIGVDVDYEFKLGGSVEKLKLTDSVEEISRFVSNDMPTLQRYK